MANNKVVEFFLAPVKRVGADLYEALPGIFEGVVILILGIILAYITKVVVRRLVLALHLERLARRLRTASILERGDVRESVAKTTAILCFWFVILIFLRFSFQVVGFETLSKILGSIISYVTNIIIAIVIMILAWALGAFIGGVVRVETSEIKGINSYLAGKVVQYVIIGVGVVMALEKLKIATPFMIVFIALVLFGAILIFAIPVGLALKGRIKEAVDNMLSNRREKRKRPERGEEE